MKDKINPVNVEKPKKLNYWNVMFWEPKSKQLLTLKENGDLTAGSMVTKAEKFLREDCIQSIGYGRWVCKPMKGYNSTTYNILEVGELFECDCQGFNRNNFCSHCLAVKQLIFMEKFNGD